MLPSHFFSHNRQLWSIAKPNRTGPGNPPTHKISRDDRAGLRAVEMGGLALLQRKLKNLKSPNLTVFFPRKTFKFLIIDSQSQQKIIAFQCN